MDEYVPNRVTEEREMNNLNPTISIIVPVYNTERYLPKCLDSIAAQTFTDFEVLMIDDGSTDGSREVCERYSRSDSRFVTIHQSNQGVSASRNNGLKQARGNYIAFVDSDDYVHPQMLELLYKAIRQGEYDLVVWNKLYDRRLLANICFSTLKVSEDWLFNTEVFSKVHKVIEIDCKLYYYLQRSMSASRHISEKETTDRINALLACSKFLVPGSMEEACCIMKLYKVLFSSRFWNRKKAYYKNVVKQISEVHRQIFKRFLRSKYISFFYKVLFMGFFYCPLLYRTFVSFCELKSRKA